MVIGVVGGRPVVCANQNPGEWVGESVGVGRLEEIRRFSSQNIYSNVKGREGHEACAI